MTRQLVDRHVVITGASRGIGRALARRLSAEGARLSLTATDRTHLDLVVAEISENGDPPETVALDLRDVDSIAAAAATLGREPIHALINNAGLLGERKNLADHPMDLWREVMAVSVDGLLDLTQRLLPSIAARGAIINVTSGAAGRAHWGAYGISRLAINGITQMLRHELPKNGIRCVAINPGGVRTELRAAAYPDEDPSEVPRPEERLDPFVAVAAGADPGWFVEAKDWSE